MDFTLVKHRLIACFFFLQLAATGQLSSCIGHGYYSDIGLMLYYFLQNSIAITIDQNVFYSYYWGLGISGQQRECTQSTRRPPLGTRTAPVFQTSLGRGRSCTLILPTTVKMCFWALELCATLTTGHPPKKKKKTQRIRTRQGSEIITCIHDLGMLPLLRWGLLCSGLIYSSYNTWDHHQNLHQFFLVIVRTRPYNFIPIRL